uniref:Uncharacterized protein n=1 Tax=Schistosoma japonicum TaxID=6182 RepID=Q5C185_SCHJA|nr:unknown [Schistosoma japonicum]
MSRRTTVVKRANRHVIQRI